MKKIVFLIMLMLISIIGTMKVQAVSYNTPVKSNLTYDECLNFQDKRISTSGSGYFGHCVKATCYGEVWRTEYFISANLVTCTNGNTSKYNQIVANGCAGYYGTGCNSSSQVRFCSVISYYDCNKTSAGNPFTTTKPTTTTKKTTKKTTTKKPVVTTTTTKMPIIVPGKSSNNYLASLTLSQGELKFDKETTNYLVEGLTEGIYLTITAVPEDAKAKVEVLNADEISFDEPITVTVTAENGDTKVYTISFSKAGGESNSKLAFIEVDGYELDFDSELLTYDLKIKKETKLSITAVAESELSEVRILGNSNLKNKSKIKIVVTAKDKSELTYIVNIKKSTTNLLPIFLIIIVLGVAGYVGFKFVRNGLARKKSEGNYEYE